MRRVIFKEFENVFSEVTELQEINEIDITIIRKHLIQKILDESYMDYFHEEINWLKLYRGLLNNDSSQGIEYNIDIINNRIENIKIHFIWNDASHFQILLRELSYKIIDLSKTKLTMDIYAPFMTMEHFNGIKKFQPNYFRLGHERWFKSDKKGLINNALYYLFNRKYYCIPFYKKMYTDVPQLLNYNIVKIEYELNIQLGYLELRIETDNKMYGSWYKARSFEVEYDLETMEIININYQEEQYKW